MKSIYETQANHIATLKAQLAIEEAKLAKIKKFPITTTMTLHSDKDSNYDLGRKLGLNEEQLQNFAYSGLEVELTILVDENGTATVTHFDDIPLKGHAGI